MPTGPAVLRMSEHASAPSVNRISPTGTRFLRHQPTSGRIGAIEGYLLAGDADGEVVVNPELNPLAEPVAGGRVFSARRRVRLGDVRPDGILRLDALTRYAQDVSNDDTGDAELADAMAWVVRRTTVDVLTPARFAESLEFETFCSGLGRRWAERRLRIVGDRGGHYEMATLWIHIDERSGRPKLLGEQFHQIYGSAAAGRTVTARLTHPTEIPSAATSMAWPLRAVDFDLFDHVNNAAYWAVLEELDPLRTPRTGSPARHVIEYRDGIGQGSEVQIRVADLDGERLVWWCKPDEDASVAASASSQLLRTAG